MSKDPCIDTFTGKKFNLLDFKAEDICIEDIAHSLSNTCRYVGHCRTFYSVAEHSIKCCERGLSWTTQMWGLLHDASEAYIGDISGPLKGLLSVSCSFGLKSIRWYEEQIIRAIAKKFDLSFPIPEEVHRIDKMLFKEEMEYLWDNRLVITMTSEGAEKIFLAYFKALEAKRNKQE